MVITMSRGPGRLLAATLAVGLVLLAGSVALAAPVGALKQFKVPTANSQPRAITTGADGNRWFTEGTEFTHSPAKVGRITPAGGITEFDVDCNLCILTDIAQGPDNIRNAPGKHSSASPCVPGESATSPPPLSSYSTSNDRPDEKTSVM